MQQRHLIEIDPQRIKFHPRNPRKHRGLEYLKLKESIKRLGIIQLPTVRVLDGYTYEVIDGEGRVSVAQEEHFEKIWVISVGMINEQEALLMLQSANTLRSYTLLAECIGLASLHRGGLTLEHLATQFTESLGKVTNMVAIGYFPQDLLDSIQEDIAVSEEQAAHWSLGLLSHLLPLREVLPGQRASGGGKWTSLDGVYNYREVAIAVQKVIDRSISSQMEMHTYVVDRRAELFQQRFNRDLQQRLKEELGKIKAEQSLVLKQAEEKIEQRVKERYQAQADQLQRQLDDLTRHHHQLQKQVARHPESLEPREQALLNRLAKAERERVAMEEERNRLARQAEQEQARWIKEQEQQALAAQRQRECWEQERKEILGEDLARQQKEQQQKLTDLENEMKTYYAQKEEQYRLKAENTIRGLLAKGIEAINEAQRIVDHTVSSSMLPAVLDLGGAQQEYFLWALRSLREALDRAEERLQRRDLIVVVEGGRNGHQS